MGNRLKPLSVQSVQSIDDCREWTDDLCVDGACVCVCIHGDTWLVVDRPSTSQQDSIDSDMVMTDHE